MTVAYHAARGIDSVSEHPAEDVAVIVERSRIAWVGPTRDLPAGTEVVDLGDATLLTGLVDTHVHLVWNASAEPHELVAQESSALMILRCARNAALHLEVGVTTVRDVGATDGLSIDIARAVELGVLPGPRVVAVGRAIAMTGGHKSVTGPGPVKRRAELSQKVCIGRRRPVEPALSERPTILRSYPLEGAPNGGPRYSLSARMHERTFKAPLTTPKTNVVPFASPSLPADYRGAYNHFTLTREEWR